MPFGMANPTQHVAGGLGSANIGDLLAQYMARQASAGSAPKNPQRFGLGQLAQLGFLNPQVGQMLAASGRWSPYDFGGPEQQFNPFGNMPMGAMSLLPWMQQSAPGRMIPMQQRT